MNSALTELFVYVMPYHKGLMHIILAFLIIYLVLTQFGINSKNYALRIRYFLPLYHGLLAAIIFTGLLLLSTFDFKPSIRVWCMIFSVFALIGISAVSHKRLKLAIKDKNFKKFRKFSLFGGLLSIVLVLFAGL